MQFIAQAAESSSLSNLMCQETELMAGRVVIKLGENSQWEEKKKERVPRAVILVSTVAKSLVIVNYRGTGKSIVPRLQNQQL